jgi:Zn-dependent peptidase ImmA (M78 family)/DNA-binding XRE family transcriptional regulator
MNENDLFRLEPVDPRLLGQRLKAARKARGVTQQMAADHLGYSRPTYIAMEKGERPASADEIIKLAAFYGQPVHELVRPGEPVADLQPHLRAALEKMKPGSEPELLRAIAELQRFAADYRELERLTNAPLRFNYPPEVRLAHRFDVMDQAEDVAIRERQRLGLGEQPIYNLRSTLEWDVGLRIFYWDLASAIAGMYVFVADLGCCILINRQHPPERRRASMLHEYGHLILDRFKPGIDYLTHRGRKPANERFAEAFAMSFLMPATSIRHRFHEIVSTTNDFRVADLCRLSNFYYVSAEAMSLRLEGLGLIPKGCWNYIKKESRFQVRKASAVLQLPAHPETKDPFPERYKFLAVHAHEQEKISEGQLARFLRCDPVTAREIVAQCLTSRMIDEDGQEHTFQLEFQNSLLPDVS